jgi:chromosome segregation ATPase
MFRIVFASLTATLLLGGTALGQNAAPAVKDEAVKDSAKPGPPSQRYRFSHTAEGILRLDNESGQVVLCRALGNGWACNPTPDETAVLQVELKRKDEEVKALTARFEQLKADIAALRNDVAAQGAEAGKQAISQEERRSLASRLALLEQDNGGLKGALARLEQENANLKKQVADTPKPPDFEPAIAQALNANDALKRELAATKEQIATLQKQITDPTDRNAQQAEIERLKKDNKDLTDKLASLEMGNAAMQSEIDALKPPVPLPKAEVPPDKKDELKLPSREEMERARAAVVDAWRRVMEMIGQLQKDMMGKSEPPVRL